MLPWAHLSSAILPNNGGELTLSQRGDEFSIKLKGKRGKVINSRAYDAEKVLAQLGCAHIKPHHDAHVLVGGLGMGYTLAAALKAVNTDSQVTVAELVPEVVEWNKGPLGDCAGNPLQDSRTKVHLGDVQALLSTRQPTFDAILLNLDNGPKGIANSDNWCCSEDGLKDIYDTLSPNGMLAIWLPRPDYLFNQRLKKIGFRVDTRNLYPRPKKGAEDTVFLARKL